MPLLLCLLFTTLALRRNSFISSLLGWSSAFSKGAKTRQTILVRIAFLKIPPQRAEVSFLYHVRKSDASDVRRIFPANRAADFTDYTDSGDLIRVIREIRGLFLQACVDRLDKHIRCPDAGCRAEARIIV